MKGNNPECPCGSQKRYSECCRPFHRGEEAPDPERLMRSRYAAFSLGEVSYLVRTLDPDHPDAARPEAVVAAEIRALRTKVRYARLQILEAPVPSEGASEGQVLFFAELYEKGKEVSFAELSTFRRHGASWRYHSGTLRAMRASDPGLAALRIEGFGSPTPSGDPV
ncbi:MAG: YchJ family metal-binding protein [Myxococcota bacterium]|nr:YchJ family metal-binding protein [Myxococcota bacterium]